jgi:hypothetical protein
VYFLEHLIEIVARLWHADAEMRYRGLLGFSPIEKKTGVRLRVFCACVIAVLVVIWLSLAF